MPYKLSPVILGALEPPSPLPAVIEFDAARLLGRPLGPTCQARVLLTTAAAGDVGPNAADPATARAAVAAGRWVTTRQVHGREVHDAAGLERREPGDGLVASASGDVLLAMFAADCALVAMVSGEGVVGVAHCGWRGLEAGVVQAVASAMRERGATSIAALRSPCICPGCYEFGEGDLARLVSRYGPGLAASTRQGSPALDLRAGVRQAADEALIERLVEVDACTACEAGWFSYRARGDTARFAVAVTA